MSLPPLPVIQPIITFCPDYTKAESQSTQYNAFIFNHVRPEMLISTMNLLVPAVPRPIFEILNVSSLDYYFFILKKFCFESYIYLHI